jgi:RNA polymerase sigma-70 factor, ECF subfamily
VTYSSGSTNCGVPTRLQASGSRSRRSKGLKKNARASAYGPAGLPSSTSAIARPDDREWQAVQEIFLASRPKFVRMAYGILRNREDAEDAVQDALLSAYVHLHAFEGRSALLTWFGRIVLNASFMIRRKRKSSRIEFFPESSDTGDGTWIEGIPASEPDPEMYSAERETLALIDGLLDKMSPMLRQAFTMTYIKGMSTAEACVLLGVSAGTFKSRLFRARRHLTNHVQRSLVAPIRRLTHSTLFRSRTNSLTRAAEPGELPHPGIAFSALTPLSYASASGTLHAND